MSASLQFKGGSRYPIGATSDEAADVVTVATIACLVGKTQDDIPAFPLRIRDENLPDDSTVTQDLKADSITEIHLDRLTGLTCQLLNLATIAGHGGKLKLRISLWVEVWFLADDHLKKKTPAIRGGFF